MVRPVFADPKTDFVFQRIFGSEDHKPVLIGFLNDLLELDDAHRIRSVTLLPPELFAERKRVLYSLDVAGLEQLLARLRDERRWS